MLCSIHYLLLLLLLVSVVSVAEAFTRDMRTHAVTLASFQGQELQVIIDPMLNSVKSTVQFLCSQLHCVDEDSFRIEVEERYSSSVEDYLRGVSPVELLHSVDMNEWLYNADTTTIEEFNKAKSMTLDLYNGLVRNDSRLRFGSDALLENLNVFSSSDVLAAAEELFNLEKYDQAMILAHYIVDSDDKRVVLRSSNLLAECYRIRGLLDIATKYASKVELLYRKQDMTANSAVHRLRVLLTIPPVPPDSNIARTFREHMIEDLQIFTDDIRDNHITVSLQDLTSDSASTPFHMAHQGLNDKDIQTAISNAFQQLCPEFSYVSPRLQRQSENRENLEKSAGEEIRVGFLSSYFYDHSIGRILAELLAYLRLEIATQTYNISVYVFFIDKQITDGSRKQDQITDILDNVLGVRFIRISDDVEVIREVVGGEDYSLDILVFGDVGMDMLSYVLAHARLAPIQVAWWGHPITTASPSIDFFFGLDIEVPNAGPSHYTEQLVRMSNMNTAPYIQISPESSPPLSTYGIPDGSKYGVVIGRLFKLHPDFDDVIFDILSNTPENMYIIVIREKVSSWNRLIYERWREKQQEICCRSVRDGQSTTGSCCGNVDWSRHDRVNRTSRDFLSERDPLYVLHRLRFVHYNHYIDLLLHATVVLDTFPYGGCLTSHDAMSNGIPMVTLPLEHVRGRYSLGMYQQMDHTDLVANNASHYSELVQKLVFNYDFRSQQSRAIAMKFKERIHRNREVALEWLSFFHKVVF